MKNKVLLSQRGHTKKDRASPVTIAIFILLIVYTLVLLVPIIWAICISFVNVTQFDIFFTMRNFNEANLTPTIENFAYAWNNLKITTTTTELTFYIPDMLVDSVIYSVGCALAFTICPAIVAYATARFKYGFSKILYIFVIITKKFRYLRYLPCDVYIAFQFLKYLFLDSLCSILFHSDGLYRSRQSGWSKQFKNHVTSGDASSI